MMSVEEIKQSLLKQDRYEQAFEFVYNGNTFVLTIGCYADEPENEARYYVEKINDTCFSNELNCFHTLDETLNFAIKEYFYE
jgi:hypothetical protein